MQPRPPARKSSRGIHRYSSVARDDPQKCGPRSALPATQAGSNGFHATPIMPWEPGGLLLATDLG